jgi:uncharacterized protein (TIGR03000 family)
MWKRFVWGASVLALAGAAVLLQPQVSEAQRRGLLRGSRGNSGYGGWGYGYGGYGAYGGPGYGYPGYGTGTSGYGYGGMNYGYGPGMPQSSQSFYPPQNGSADSPNAVHIKVVVPDPNTQVLIDGSPTKQTGNEREFVTEMKPGTSGTYDIKARWTANGQPREEVRNVSVQPGAWRVVDFTRSQGSNPGATNRVPPPPKTDDDSVSLNPRP